GLGPGGAGGGGLARFVAGALGGLTPLGLPRLYSTDLRRSRRRARGLLWRRFWILLAKDLSRLRLSAPNARGILFAWRWLGRIFAKNKAEVRAWDPVLPKQHAEGAARRA